MNYVSVHAYGRVSAFLDGDELKAHMTAFTGCFESSNDSPWKIDDAPADYIDAMCWAITGIQVLLTHIEGKRKHSQSRDIDNSGASSWA